MRNVISILTAAVFAASMAFVACSSDDEEKAPAKLTLDKATLTMAAGGAAQMLSIDVTKITDANLIQELQNSEVTWSSSATAVVGFGYDGAADTDTGLVATVKPKSSGKATVTARVPSGATGTCEVTVNEPAKLTLDKATLYMTVGGMATINITAPVNAEVLQATWSSSDATKVTCGMGSTGSSSVIVNAVAAGTATVTARVPSGATGTCEVTVIATAAFLDGSPVEMAAGDCIVFTDPRPDMSALVSSDAGVVDFVVAPGGQVVGMVANSVGTADVTFTGADGEKVTCAVTVVPGN
jgi:hypothetical protein